MGEEKPTIELLNYKLDQLCRTVEDGFKGVHARQDKTSDNVKRNTEWRLKNTQLPKLVYGVVGMVLVAVGAAVINLVVN